MVNMTKAIQSSHFACLLMSSPSLRGARSAVRGSPVSVIAPRCRKTANGTGVSPHDAEEGNGDDGDGDDAADHTAEVIDNLVVATGGRPAAWPTKDSNHDGDPHDKPTDVNPVDAHLATFGLRDEVVVGATAIPRTKLVIAHVMQPVETAVERVTTASCPSSVSACGS